MSVINYFNPYTGENRVYKGKIIKETKIYLTFEINPNFNKNRHHAIIKVPKAFIANILL